MQIAKKHFNQLLNEIFFNDTFNISFLLSLRQNTNAKEKNSGSLIFVKFS